MNARIATAVTKLPPYQAFAMEMILLYKCAKKLIQIFPVYKVTKNKGIWDIPTEIAPGIPHPNICSVPKAKAAAEILHASLTLPESFRFV